MGLWRVMGRADLPECGRAPGALSVLTSPGDFLIRVERTRAEARRT